VSAKTPDYIDVEVGQRIRIQRLTAGLTQTALADELGVTFQQVQKYEKGVNRVGAGRLTKIAKVLGLPVSDFFGANDGGIIEQHGTVSSPLKLLTVPGALRLLRAYGRINDGKLRRVLIGMVEGMAAGRR
jgi:transcriptional regulator with XRE-family HTH domain